MTYDKPHLPVDQQLAQLVKRGLRHSDERSAIDALRSIGYYRLSGYSFPFRNRLPEGDRLDTFVDGVTFEDVVGLHDFDQALRRTLSNGLEEVEVGLRTRMAYHLGKVDPFAHLDPELLDPAKCANATPDGETAHDRWVRTYERQWHEARNEEYVKHFIAKYGGDPPIWIAAECLSFGCLVRLFSLVGDDVARHITRSVKIGERSLVHRYLMALLVLRNHCAHHARVWNRTTVFPPGVPPKKLTHERIHHLSAVDRNRVYALAVLTGHFAIQFNPATNWPRKFKETAKRFPAPNGMTLCNQMGFPAKWADEDIWKYDPKQR